MNNRDIVRSFKAKGLAVSVDASRVLLDVLTSETDPAGSLAIILDEIRERIEKREIKTSVIDVEIIKSIVADLSSNEDDLALESTQLINAYNAPRIEFDERQKVFRVNSQPKCRLHGTVESRAQMYRERLLLIQQRLLRSGGFALRGMGNAQSGRWELSTISSLLGGKGQHMLLGLLTQPEEGVYHLEDFDACIPLDLSNAQTSLSCVTEGCVVLVQGTLVGNNFNVHVSHICLSESRAVSMEAIGVVDIFGNNFRSSQMSQMKELEDMAVDTMFVFLSDMQLDRPNWNVKLTAHASLHVCENFRRVLEGFEQIEDGHIVFVLMGPFAGRAVLGGGQSGGGGALELALTSLADVICSYPGLKDRAGFVLVPAWEDAGTGSVLPLRPLPTVFSSDLQHRVPKLSLATNPCRIRFYTQEIVIFREDILKRDGEKGGGGRSGSGMGLTERLCRCLLEQGHLNPLPTSTSRPIVWDLDYTMRLFPLPNLLILAESSEQFSYIHMDCQVINPGSFSVDSSFVVYRPAGMQVEFSRVTAATATIIVNITTVHISNHISLIEAEL
eukprot:gene9213-19109_t